MARARFCLGGRRGGGPCGAAEATVGWAAGLAPDPAGFMHVRARQALRTRVPAACRTASMARAPHLPVAKVLQVLHHLARQQPEFQGLFRVRHGALHGAHACMRRRMCCFVDSQGCAAQHATSRAARTASSRSAHPDACCAGWLGVMHAAAPARFARAAVCSVQRRAATPCHARCADLTPRAPLITT